MSFCNRITNFICRRRKCTPPPWYTPYLLADLKLAEADIEQALADLKKKDIDEYRKM